METGNLSPDGLDKCTLPPWLRNDFYVDFLVVSSSDDEQDVKQFMSKLNEAVSKCRNRDIVIAERSDPRLYKEEMFKRCSYVLYFMTDTSVKDFKEMSQDRDFQSLLYTQRVITVLTKAPQEYQNLPMYAKPHNHIHFYREKDLQGSLLYLFENRAMERSQKEFSHKERVGIWLKENRVRTDMLDEIILETDTDNEKPEENLASPSTPRTPIIINATSVILGDNGKIVVQQTES